MTKRITRRQMTEGLLASLGGFFLLRCSGGGTLDAEDTADDAGDAAVASDATSGSATTWARGGTAAMTAKASYDDPFATPATSCVLLVAATEGPCTEVSDEVREDISEGYAGLPLRLTFRVVDTACAPIANATVKIWHTQLDGSYSGVTPNPQMCLKDQADSAKHYFRGTQTTDTDGRVSFDSCFPGWYQGRTPHIHYTVTVNGKTFTSQLVFDQSVVQDIFASHPDYEQFGQPDTTNAADNVVGTHALSTFILTVARQVDGAMLASKQLVVFTA